MEVKVNREIRSYTESMFFGLSLRQFIFSVLDKYCSSLDLLPTISNLFSLKYDSRLLMGNDVFSDADPLIVLNSRN